MDVNSVNNTEVAPVEGPLPAENATTEQDEIKALAEKMGFDGDVESSEIKEEKEKAPEEPKAEEQEEKEEPETSKRGAEARKEQLNSEIRELNSQKHQIEREIEQARAVREYQASINDSYITPEQLEAEGWPHEEAVMKAFEINQQVQAKQIALNNYKNQVMDLRQNLTIDRYELVKDYPVFDVSSDKYNEEFTNKALEIYGKVANLQFDEDGNVISADQPLYSFMSEIADLAEVLSAGATKEARKAIEKQLASTSVDSSQGIAEDSTDDFVKNFFK